MNDFSRKDKCEPVEGKLFSGGKAMIFAGPKEFHGKVVFLSQQDNFGWWEAFDRRGDMLYIDNSWLMPVSIEDWDDKTDLDTFLYEARYGA